MKNRRGFTIVELLIGAVIGTMTLSLTIGVLRFCNVVWYKTDAQEEAKEHLHRAVERIAPDIRSALFVDVAASSSTKLVLAMPQVDGNGNYIVPLSEGSAVAFYMSNATGNPNVNGSILWRSVNGSPDTSWSKSGSKGRIDLGSGVISFTFTPTNDPEYVTIVFNAAKTKGNQSVSGTTTTKVFLRNHSYISGHRDVVH